MSFPIGAPWEPSLYLQQFSRYSAQTHVNEQTHTHTHTHQQTRRIAIPPGGGNNSLVTSKIQKIWRHLADRNEMLVSGYTTATNVAVVLVVVLTFNVKTKLFYDKI